jgi:DNA-binding NarL/FixJ family response regulator
MANENLPRVLLADDHPGVIEYVSNLLSKDFEVVGVVSDGLLVADAVKETHPDLIVMDISMPGLDGIRIAQSLRRSNDTSKIVFLTVADDEEYISAAFAAGAAGYVLKARLQSDLIFALNEALSGRTFVSRRSNPRPGE